ncbi:hypothetical protein [Schaalia sp. lx-260]|uniref:hypothetical protein n=1 Tax=Schaalia sp. lx-260 TaxID=2899082 RepID=UPI001E28D002|nr:hypothetical protein [Schaalia sp. lx-260]MCD4549393.1 hypothetical protein [Schaalia sp. lx-260]
MSQPRARWPSHDALVTIVRPWLNTRRWFPAGNDSAIAVVSYWEHIIPYVSNDAARTYVLSTDQGYVQLPLVCTLNCPTPEQGFITKYGEMYLADGPAHPAWITSWFHEATLDSFAPAFLKAQRVHATKFPLSPHVLSGEQSNTSVLFSIASQRMILKVYRVLCAGLHPDLEIGAALAAAKWPHISPPVAHSLICFPQHNGTENTALGALMCPFIPDATDGFTYFVDLARRRIDPFPAAERLGKVTADMHRELCSALGHSEAADPLTLSRRITSELALTVQEVPQLDTDLYEKLQGLIDPLCDMTDIPVLMRIHGDYHLGQTLLADRWYIVDFEGEPLRPIDQRRRPDLALRDVAGMLRSFSYAQAQALRQEDAYSVSATHSHWITQATRGFLQGYMQGKSLRSSEETLLKVLILEKAAYELRYEYRMRPEWLSIPLDALRNLTENKPSQNSDRNYTF